MKQYSVVGIIKNPDRFLSLTVKGNFAEVVSKAESGVMQIGTYKSPCICFTAVAVNISSQDLP